MTLAKVSLYLFSIGAIGLVIAFVLDVVHTTQLAVGRRRPTVPAPTGLVPAGAAQARASVQRRRVGMRTAAVDSLPYQTPTTAGSLGHAFTWLTFICFVLSLAIRGWIVGRGPWGNMYEFSIAFATGILLGYLFLARRYPIRSIAFVPLGVALFLVGYAATLPSAIEPLVPALANAPLLTIHVSMAMISYGIFAVSFAAALGYLAQGQGDRFAWLPSHKVLDEVAYRAVIIGFPIFAALIILGSYWASIAWGRYWGWDPKETAALVTWLIYAVYLHARNLKGWSGRPAALILVIGFVRGAVHLLRQPLLLGAALLQRAVAVRRAAGRRAAGPAAAGRVGGGTWAAPPRQVAGRVNGRSALGRLARRIRAEIGRFAPAGGSADEGRHACSTRPGHSPAARVIRAAPVATTLGPDREPMVHRRESKQSTAAAPQLMSADHAQSAGDGPRPSPTP